ncbi:NUDIX hydrolase [Aureimonas sp. AU20]|uniref:NUDIX hydrolase n=1 Tax=Aureimonas sp. AU20 TaxID=1349819 RepID=UPI0007207292|nr:NUDIX hydrolase [Aureimonas sp. AU20]ALN71793.1 hypothetical protein M673_03650 [Aureimonas sp. AU20]
MKRADEAETCQIAALPIWVDETARVRLGLVTSRQTHRWIIPKGWPMKGLADFEAARIEAKEEAGLRGEMLHQPIGTYHYWQRKRTDFQYVTVATYLMRVTGQKSAWKEQHERRFEWVTLREAAERLEEPELVSMVADLSENERARRFLRGGDKPAPRTARSIDIGAPEFA